MAESQTEIKDQAPAIDEAAVKTYLKDKYGIEDDPETFKGKLSKWREAETQLPQYTTALQQAGQLLRQQEAERQRLALAATKPTEKATEPDETALREVARVDPYAVIKRSNSELLDTVRGLLAEHAQQTRASVSTSLTMQQRQDMAGQRLRSEYPEAYDPQSELHKEGLKIYWQEMSEAERQHPEVGLIVAERAAGRLGLAPVSRRKAADESPRAVEREVAAQQVGGRGSRRPTNSDEPIRLNDREKEIADAMGVDHKLMQAAKKARRSGENFMGETK